MGRFVLLINVKLQCETCDSIASEHYLNEMQKKYEKRTAGDERYLE